MEALYVVQFPLKHPPSSLTAADTDPPPRPEPSTKHREAYSSLKYLHINGSEALEVKYGQKLVAKGTAQRCHFMSREGGTTLGVKLCVESRAGNGMIVWFGDHLSPHGQYMQAISVA